MKLPNSSSVKKEPSTVRDEYQVMTASVVANEFDSPTVVHQSTLKKDFLDHSRVQMGVNQVNQKQESEEDEYITSGIS
jgi:hypothetical protein